MANQVLRALSCLVILIVVAADPALAEWLPGGTPVCTIAGRQDLISASADGQGGAFVCWNDYRTPGGGLYVLRLTHGGDLSPGWPTGGLRVVALTTSQPTVAGDGLGGCYVVWAAGAPTRIVVMHLLSNGTPDPAWPAAGVALSYIRGSSLRSAVVDSRGSLIVVYGDTSVQCDARGCFGSVWYAILARLNLAGAWTGGISTSSPSSGVDVAAPDTDGGVWFATTDNYILHVYHMDAQGQVVNPWPNPDPLYLNHVSPLAAASDAGVYISWAASCAGEGFTLQRLLPSGKPAAGWPVNLPEPCGEPNHSRWPVFTSAGDKRPLVVWSDSGPDRTSRLLATSLDSSGSLQTGWPAGGLVLCDAPGYRQMLDLVPDGTGGGLTVWQDWRDGIGRSLYATHVGGTGTLAPGWIPEGTLVASTLGLPPDRQALPVVTDAAGGAITFWVDARDSSTTGYDVYAQRLVADGPVPTQLSLVSAEFRDGRVVLDWFAPDAPTLNTTVYRRTESTGWLALGVPTSNGTGHLRYEDRAVGAGTRLAYRIGYLEQGVEHFTPETWVQTLESRLSLEGLRPNPAMGPLTVAFSLQSSEPALIEMMDLGGRRVAQREVGALGAGPHVIDLAEARATRPGIYWLRLRQGERVLLARGAVVR